MKWHLAVITSRWSRRVGFECKRVRGSHERWIHPKLPELPVTLAGKNSQDAKPYLEKLVESALQKLNDKEQGK